MNGWIAVLPRSCQIGTERCLSIGTVRCLSTAACAGAPQDKLAACRFAFVILDEASQMVEPASLLPVARFGARCLLAVGDPQQLPPLVADAAPPPGAAGLGRALFVRLAAAGHVPLRLVQQYRCHPALASVPNAAFYGGLLQTAVEATQRAPLLPGLPPLTFLDIRQGQEERQRGCGSMSNPAEARCAAIIVRHLLASGVPPADVGVIAFYRAQARAGATARPGPAATAPLPKRPRPAVAATRSVGVAGRCLGRHAAGATLSKRRLPPPLPHPVPAAASASRAPAAAASSASAAALHARLCAGQCAAWHARPQ